MYNLFSYFPTYSISKSKIAGTLAETVDISSVVHRSLRDQFVSTTVQNKGFSFETIINADSFSLISKRKQCRCFITLLLLDWARVRSSKNFFWNICRVRGTTPFEMYARHHFSVRVYRQILQYLFVTRAHCPLSMFPIPVAKSSFSLKALPKWTRPSKKGIKVRPVLPPYAAWRFPRDSVYTTVNMWISYMWTTVLSYEYECDLHSNDYFLSSNGNKA